VPAITENPYIEFICPECGGRHFGSLTEKRLDGSIWKTHEVCHDEHDIGCKWQKEKMVCVVKVKA
jgi:hypothetical protein